MKTRSVFALFAAMLLPLFTFAADLVSDYAIDGTTYTRSEGWLVSQGLTVILKYSGFEKTSGDCAFITLKQTSGTNENKIGIGAKDGKFYGIYNDNIWTDVKTGASVPSSGMIVFSYSSNWGTNVYSANGDCLYSASGLKETSSAIDRYPKLGMLINIGALADSTLASGIIVEEVAIYNSATASTDVADLIPFIPSGALKYGYDFNGTSFTKEDAASESLTAAKPDTIIASQVNGVLQLDVDAGSHYGSGFSYGTGDWSIAVVAKATGEGEVIYAMGGQRGATGLIGLRNAGDNTIEAFTANATKVTSVTLESDPVEAYHLYTVVYSNGKLKMNVDGGEFSQEASFAPGTDGRWQFGGIHGGFEKLTGVKNATSGLMDEFRVYTIALTKAQTYGLAKELGVFGERPTAEVIKENDSWTIDTTKAPYALLSAEINELKTNAISVTLKSESEYGATIDLGSNTMSQKAHYVFASGTHTLKWAAGKLDNGSLDFDTTGTDENPSILVKNGATLNFYAKDVTGWKHDAKDAKTSVIKVESGATLKLYKNDNNTWYFQGRFIIEPGATVEAVDFETNKFCMNGGSYADYQQLYVPAPAEGNTSVATYTSNVGFRLASDTTIGYAAFIEEGATLQMNGQFTTADTNAEFGKYGEGVLELTGNVGPNVKFVLGGGVIKMKSIYARQDGKIRLADDVEGGLKETTDGEWIIYEIEPSVVFNPETDTVATTPVLRFSEIMPKPSDKPNSITTEAGYDKNGLESGWVELENTSETEWADLADYKFIRVNRSKANSKGDYGNFPSVKIPPRSKYIFYTSERYSNSADMTVSAWATPYEADAEGNGIPQPVQYGSELHNMLVWPDKINPKKYPFVRLYFKDTTIIDTVVIPSDIPEGHSIIVKPLAEGEATVRYMTNKPTKGAENTALEDASIVKLGPNVGPLYEAITLNKKGKEVIGEKHTSASEFGAVAMAKAGEDYPITFALNPTMSPTKQVQFREADKFKSVTLVYRTWTQDGPGKEVEIVVMDENVAYDPTWDKADQGYVYTTAIPSTALPSAGQLIQWKFKVVDNADNEWMTPSFHNKDDGYEWYGTIVEPTEAQTSASLPTWHMFADPTPLNGTKYSHMTEMDLDADFNHKKPELRQHAEAVPYNARVAIYDASTQRYYDYVRIDLRGNTSAYFNKKSHGLRFSKANPLTMTDIVSGETLEGIRKTSLIGEPADPSRMRQMMAFWLWNKMGNKVPFDFPVRVNRNGVFYQLGFNSERFTDELIEDVYGFDKFGYGYKNVGTLASGGTTSAGSIEKKTPDDGNESDISVLEDELRKPLKDKGIDNLSAKDNAEHPAITKFVVEKFNLPAWLNYLASARITQEMDDVWANISIYYDNAQMLEEGAYRGTGTWMPLGYDFNLTFGQYYINDIAQTDAAKAALREKADLMSNQDWFKSHPLYGGNVVRCYKQEAMTATCNEGNRGIEAVLQSPKFRRLYLRRLRTLMDQELLGVAGDDETLENTKLPVMVKMREMAELMRDDANLDTTTYPWDRSIGNIDDWGSANWPSKMDDGIAEIWTKYIVPRRQHLYVTHAAEGHESEKIGYGTTLCAGIPAAQSPILSLRDKITAEYDAVKKAVVIRNANAETIDLSNWKLEGPVNMTIPAGTVIDEGTQDNPGEVFIVLDRRAYVAALGESVSNQVIVGNATAGKSDVITLTAADETKVVFTPTPEYYNLRLHSFDGVTPVADGDSEEWLTLTNISNSATLDLTNVRIRILKDGDAEVQAKLDITLNGGTLGPSGTIKLEQAAYGWSKITNNKIHIAIWDANSSQVQYAFVTQKNYTSYYGDAGSNTAPIGGKFYLEATSFEQTLGQADFTEVAYPIPTWEEITEETDISVVLPGLTEAQKDFLDASEVTAADIAKWATEKGGFEGTATVGGEIDLVAFALNCAPNEEAIDAAKKNFKVTITMTEEGPVAEIESGFYNITPVLKGKVELPEENWIEVTEENKDSLKFFKAVIELPSEE